jgi:Fe-S-cluster-containing dehydrogenase component
MADEPKIAPECDCPLCPDPNCGQPMIGARGWASGRVRSNLLDCIGCGQTIEGTPEQVRQARKADNAYAQKLHREEMRRSVGEREANALSRPIGR